MTQLVTQPGRNAARQAKKLKEIRKVKAAIKWHERERKKRQEFKQELWAAKQFRIERRTWQQDNVHAVQRRALKETREDWNLGPLRPSRNARGDPDKYGALTETVIQKPDIPTHFQKVRNEVRVRKGLEEYHPLVVDDEKYFPIVKDDRVMIMSGQDEGKIGKVLEVMPRTHELIVKDMNKQFYDADLFKNGREEMGPLHESEVAIPITKLRLVVPYAEGNGQQRDRIVEKIIMERHTTGIDPFTGTDYGDAKIPEEHRYDPSNGLPIFHRYIAGTRERIEWPWEKEEEKERDDAITDEYEAPQESLLKRTIGTIRHPITSLQRWRKPEPLPEPEPEPEPEITKKDLLKEYKGAKKQEPKSHRPYRASAHDGTDTTRNLIENPEYMRYTLLTPPMPEELSAELRDDIREFKIEAAKREKKDRDRDAPLSVKFRQITEQGTLAGEALRERRRAAERMKTPMQLRWEIEHAKKVKHREENPLVDTDTLLAALGQHMRKNGVRMPKSKRRKENAWDVD